MNAVQLEHLTKDWRDIKDLVVYGFGRTGKALIDLFVDKFHVKYIIDNDSKYRGQVYRDIPIIDFEYYKKGGEHSKIVIVAGGSSTDAISAYLEEMGLVQNRDFCGVQKFLKEWFWGFHHQACVGRLSTYVTTGCTLKCEQCAQFITYQKERTDFSLDLLKNDLHLLFQSLDYVSCLIVLGGEPLLYHDLAVYLDYLGENYCEKIGRIQLITNGTIMPSPQLIQVIKRHHIRIRISDYTNQVPYRKKLDATLHKLNEENIECVVFPEMQWWDVGFPQDPVNMGDTPEELRQHMLHCQPYCQGGT